MIYDKTKKCICVWRLAYSLNRAPLKTVICDPGDGGGSDTTGIVSEKANFLDYTS